MRALMLLLVCAAPASGDVAVHGGGAVLTGHGFVDGDRIGPLAVSPSRHWLAVVNQNEPCCIAATLSLLVMTERGAQIEEIPFACADEEGHDCEDPTPLERPRANRLLRRHGFVVSADAVWIPKLYGEESFVQVGEVTIRYEDSQRLVIQQRRKVTKLDVGRLSFVVYLPSKQLLIYRWFRQTPEGGDWDPPYWGVVVKRLSVNSR